MNRIKQDASGGRKRRPTVNRRAFLTGTGGAALALPFLEGLPERSAFAQDESPRFAFFICAANGVAQAYDDEPERFWPTKVGALSSSQMEADSAERCTGILAEHAERLLIVSGLQHEGVVNMDSHVRGRVQALTGLLPTDSSTIAATSRGPSVDWVIAQAWQQDPLLLYAGPRAGYVDDRISFSAAGMLHAGEKDPAEVYGNLTGLSDSNTGGPSAALEELYQRRKSVNDLVRGELSVLLSDSKLSQEDRYRLDKHLTSIRDAEVELMKNECGWSTLPREEIQTIGKDGHTEDLARLHMMLAGVAFSCNLARVATLQWGDGGGDSTRYVLNGEETPSFHWISHRVSSDGAYGSPIEGAAEMHAQIDRIRMKTFNSMLDHFSELSTPQGALFDSAFAYWSTDVSIGPIGGHFNLPVIIAGSPAGTLKQGEYLDAGGVGHPRLLRSLMEAVGVDSSTFAGGNELLQEVLA